MQRGKDDRMEQGTHEPELRLLPRGRGYLQDYHKPENVDSAIAVFKHALERDPNYARAYAGLGESYWRSISTRIRGTGIPGRRRLQTCRGFGERFGHCPQLSGHCE